MPAFKKIIEEDPLRDRFVKLGIYMGRPKGEETEILPPHKKWKLTPEKKQMLEIAAMAKAQLGIKAPICVSFRRKKNGIAGITKLAENGVFKMQVDQSLIKQGDNVFAGTVFHEFGHVKRRYKYYALDLAVDFAFGYGIFWGIVKSVEAYLRLIPEMLKIELFVALVDFTRPKNTPHPKFLVEKMFEVLKDTMVYYDRFHNWVRRHDEFLCDDIAADNAGRDNLRVFFENGLKKSEELYFFDRPEEAMKFNEECAKGSTHPSHIQRIARQERRPYTAVEMDRRARLAMDHRQDHQHVQKFRQNPLAERIRGRG